jgi:ATP-dependent helicase/nuclease subunit A
VSVLQREQEDEDEAPEIFARPFFGREGRSAGKLSAAEIGSAHHVFLRAVSLAQVTNAELLRSEAARMRDDGLLSEAEISCLDFRALGEFWQSEIGRQIMAQAENVRRELPVTARFSPMELPGPALEHTDDGEFVVVQGVIDLAVIQPTQIWLLDFKTDHFAEEDLAAKINLHRLQLSLYREALARIYNRPVTKTWLHFLAMGKTVVVAD